MSIPTHAETVLLPDKRAPNESGVKRRVRLRALVFMVVALVAGLCAAWLIRVYLERQAPQVALPPMVQVAVAAADLPVATTLRAEMVTFIEWPEKSVLPGSFTDIGALTGRVLAAPLVKGEPIVEGRLAESGRGVGLAALIPPSMRAMTVRVNEVIGVSGFIHPGDVVDVLTTMRAPMARGSTIETYHSRVVLQGIRVLAAGEELTTRNERPIKVPVVTLLVTPEQSERLALAHTHGELQLTLRSRTDRDETVTAGITPEELLGVPSPRQAPPAAAPPAQKLASVSHPRGGRPSRPQVEPVRARVEPEVVEVLRGDKFEEKRIRTPVKEQP